MEELQEEPDASPVTHAPPPLRRQPTMSQEERDRLSRRCCTFAEIKERPEIVLWYFGNMLSYLGFFMPFLNLVSFYQYLGNIPYIHRSWYLYHVVHAPHYDGYKDMHNILRKINNAWLFFEKKRYRKWDKLIADM